MKIGRLWGNRLEEINRKAIKAAILGSRGSGDGECSEIMATWRGQNSRCFAVLTLVLLIYVLGWSSLVRSLEISEQVLNGTQSSSDGRTEVDRSDPEGPGDAPGEPEGQSGFDDESDEEEGGETQSVVVSNSSRLVEEGGSEDAAVGSSSNSNSSRPVEEWTGSRGNETSIEQEIEIIRSKIMNSSFRLDDFYARSVFDRLFEMFEPASERVLDFEEIHRNLTRIIDTSRSSSNIGDSYGVLAYLWFYGIPDRRGRLEFPQGWPRNVDIALRYALKGATKFNCGFCYTLMGLLFAWGYPPLVNNTHGWIGVDNSTTKQDPHKTSVSKNTYFLYHSPHKYSNEMSPEEVNLPTEKNGFDLVAMNYALASKNKDVFGQLASSYYLRYGLSDISYQYSALEYSSAFSLHRVPRNLTSETGISSLASSRCIVALEPLIYVASKTLSDNRDVFLPDVSTLLRGNSPKEHDTKHYAEWVKSLAADRDPEGMTSLGELYYYGHEAGGIARDVNRAAQLWEESARRGDPQGALARAFLNLDGTIGTERDSGPYLRQVARYGEPPAAALANYYIYKLGLEVERNSTIAGEYLKLAADLGDGNAQLILAHAYAGGKMGVVPPGGQNDTLALKYYKLSAEGGRTVSYFNSAVLTLKGSDSTYRTEESRCIASMDYLSHVVKKNNSVKLLSLLSKRSFENGDMVGALLREMTLSEMGFVEGHINSQDLWKERSILFSREAIKSWMDRNDHETAKFSEPVCGVSEGGSHRDDSLEILLSRLATCVVETEDESSGRLSTLYPSQFEMEMSGVSSRSFCLVQTSRREVFHAVPVNFDRSLLHLKSRYFKYYDMFSSQNATLRGSLDVNYTRSSSAEDRSRVSEFLGCWMRPRSYYRELERSGGHALGGWGPGLGGEQGQEEEEGGQEEEEEEGSVFDRLLELWLRPMHGSYNRYPRPWYRVFGGLMGALRYLWSSYLVGLIGRLSGYFGYSIDKDRMEEWDRALSKVLIDLDQDLVMDEKRVPRSIQLHRNSSLWCSHYYARRASVSGDIASTQNLVEQFLEGSFGVERDPVSAYKFIEQGVASRDPKSIVDYAIALNKGIGVRRDKSRSYRLLWHLIARGPFNMEDLLPKIPSGPRLSPSILDTIRETLIPLMRNSTNSTAEGSASSNHTYITAEDKTDQSGNLENAENKDLSQNLGQDSTKSNSSEEPRYRKGRRARMSDTINMNYRTQQDLATRVSSFGVLAILTLDWVYYNVILRHYYSSIALKNQILSSLAVPSSEDAREESSELLEPDQAISENSNGPLYTNQDGTCIYSNGRVIPELFGRTHCEPSEAIQSLKKDDQLVTEDGDGGSRGPETVPAAEADDDPFPLSSRFRYISDEEYKKASNIWKASISIRLYYFILRIVIIVGAISVLIPLSIAITEKISDQS
ncbi:hypothetical protein OJ252_1314 [Cryptosporidium canis]|uniref:Sel1 repeat-containing protein n=1 Tax=Cryptosporidium canis TaxID=195482 RepID=A0ABQ8P8S3_9CRYT|nr:hypothetical protein OJ252_1314 [Cryptosporidium canis]